MKRTGKRKGDLRPRPRDARGIPGGRSKRRPISEELHGSLEQKDKAGKTTVELIAWRVVQKALKGDLAAVREITNRTEGRAPRRTQQGTRGREPIQFIVTVEPRSK